MLRHSLLALAFTVILAPAVPAQQQDSGPGMDQMHDMQRMMDRAGKSTDPAERRKLMRQHMQEMHKRMRSMHGMMGTPPDVDTQEQIRELRKRLDLMQLMMEQMMLQHRIMMEESLPEKEDQEGERDSP